jgi:RNA polymerase sigma factor (TIGR02999 family)
VYAELRRLAGLYMRRERSDHTLSPTALVAEAFLRMVGGEHPQYEDRVQFFAVAARHMRRILVDHARRRTAQKRGGYERPEPINEEMIAATDRPEEMIALDDALDALAVMDERKAQAVELHYFSGMSQKEVAAALGVHENTIANDLRMARAWLHRHMLRAMDGADAR